MQTSHRASLNYQRFVVRVTKASSAWASHCWYRVDDIQWEGVRLGFGSPSMSLPFHIACIILYLEPAAPLSLSLCFILFSSLPISFPSFLPPRWRPPSVPGTPGGCLASQGFLQPLHSGSQPRAHRQSSRWDFCTAAGQNQERGVWAQP